MAIRIQMRRDTAANWTSVNPILGQGEFGYETDTGLLKMGDGLTIWNSLSYFATGSINNVVNVDGSITTSLSGDEVIIGVSDYISKTEVENITGDFVLKSGDTMTGPLILSQDSFDINPKDNLQFELTTDTGPMLKFNGGITWAREGVPKYRFISDSVSNLDNIGLIDTEDNSRAFYFQKDTVNGNKLFSFNTEVDFYEDVTFQKDFEVLENLKVNGSIFKVTEVIQDPVLDTVTFDLQKDNCFIVNIVNDMIIENPINWNYGDYESQTGRIIFINGLNSPAAAFGNWWKFEGGEIPTFTGVPGAIDMLVYEVISADISSADILAHLIKDIK